jgi:hypothetical protein
MSTKEALRAYLSEYGEVKALNDIASILSDLSDAWKTADEKVLSYTFSDASCSVADAAHKLANADANYSSQLADLTAEQVQDKRIQSEFNFLMKYFERITRSDLKELYEKNKEELASKLKRLEYLKKYLDKKNDKQ